jgi:hypothetical protein
MQLWSHRHIVSHVTDANHGILYARTELKVKNRTTNRILIIIDFGFHFYKVENSDILYVTGNMAEKY